MDYITIDKKKYPFWFAIKANRELSKNDKLAEKDDLYFLWLGFKYGSIYEKKTFPYTEEALVDIFEEDIDLFAKAEKLLAVQMGKMKAAKAPALAAILK